MFKKFSNILLIVLVSFSPLFISALQDSYTITTSGAIDTGLRADYIWLKDGEVKSGFVSAEEKKNLKNAVCDSAVYKKYVRYKATCSAPGATCKKSLTNLAFGYGKTKTEAQNNCKNSLQRNFSMDTCTNPNNALLPKYQNEVEEVYSKQSPAKDDPSQKYWIQQGVGYSCTWSDSTTGVGPKTLYTYEYTAKNGNDVSTAWCVHPGQRFENNTYIKMDEYDTEGCVSPQEDARCAYAAIIGLANKKGLINNGNIYDYAAVTTALRLVAAAFGEADGWWEQSSGIQYSTANIFQTTLTEILGNGYNGTSKPSNIGVIYGVNDQSSLKKAIELYKTVMDPNYEIWVPSVEVLETNFSDYGTVTAQLKINLNVHNIPAQWAIRLSDGTPVSYTWGAIGNDYTIINLSFTANMDELTFCSEGIDISIDYHLDGDDAISKVGLYKHATNPDRFQYMYVFDSDANSTIDVTLGCPDMYICEFVNGTYYGLGGYPVTRDEFESECKDDYCVYSGPEYEMPSDCETDGTIGYIKDPAMCTILGDKTVRDDYNSGYGNEYCDIYCRETLEFSFMDKETALAGRYFKHNVSSYYSNKQNLSTVILSSRQCTSLIDYESWESDYITANEKVRTTWNEFKKAEAINKYAIYTSGSTYCGKSDDTTCSYITGRTYVPEKRDVKGQLISRATCTGGTTVTKTGTGCKAETLNYHGYYVVDAKFIETDSNGVNTTKDIADIQDKRGGASCGHNPYCTDTTSVDSCNSTCSCESCRGRGVTNHDIPGYDTEKSAYDTAVQNRKNLIDKINSCNFEVGSYAYNEVMSYAPGNTILINYEENTNPLFNDSDDNKYPVYVANDSTDKKVVKRSYSMNTDWIYYCSGDCKDDLYYLDENSSYIKQGDKTADNKKYYYWECSGGIAEQDGKPVSNNSMCDNTLFDGTSGVKIPNNRVANIVVEMETVHYQENKFYTQIFTGITKDRDHSREGDYWIPLEDHVYPVDKNRLTGNYQITVNYDELGDRTRINEFEGGEYICSYDVINELTIYDCDDGYHTCYPCYGPSCEDTSKGIGLYYRTIDLNDIFPHSSFSPTYEFGDIATRNIGQNWLSSTASQVIKEIQENGENVWVNKTPMYSVSLTPSDIRDIREKNKGRTYLDNDYLECSDTLRCKTTFFDELRLDYTKNTTIGIDSLYYYQYKRGDK